MKKILATILLISFISSTFCSLAYGEEPSSTINNKIEKLSTTYKKLNKKEYKRTTVYKHYVPYEVTFKNIGEVPILMTTQTEVEFITNDDSILKSDSRRDIYKRTRKKDRGRHYALQVPGVILGTCISVGTFLLGTPVGYGVYKAMQYPTIKAARTNVNILQDLYSAHGLPLRFEPNIEYSIYFYMPTNKDKIHPVTLKAIRIKNVSLNNELRDIEIPLITATPSAVDENVTPVHFEKQTNISEEPSENNIMEEE